MSRTALLALFVMSRMAHAQTPGGLLERVERLERANQEQSEEIRRLRAELEQLRAVQNTPETAPEPLAERVSVNQQRIEDQAQSKVESAQKLPIRISGMALFNAYANSRFGSGGDYPTVAALTPGPRDVGATVRQSVIGLEFHGPETIGGGKISGTLFMDFFAGTSSTLNQVFRIRTSSIQIDWSRTTLLVGQQKPIFSPRDPTSLAQVGVSPLTNAGNPWLWQPQVRVDQNFRFGEDTGLRAQLGIFQTNEGAAILPSVWAGTLERTRPALQGRFEFRHKGLEIAPGFHVSTTHVAGASVPSNAVSVDWLVAPFPKVQLTGLFYTGQNIANLGTLRQGFTILGSRSVIPVHSKGGWAQLAFQPAKRISLNLMHGQQDDRDSDLRAGGFGKNQSWAGNIMFRIAPNVVLAWESSQTRTTYIGSGTRKNNHHDLALAYLF